MTEATIAYYTAVDDDHTGWTGGLLVLNHGGRPLEFRCTLPVRPTRTHVILFGPTLRDCLIGDIIGPALVDKCQSSIGLLCCDQPESLRMCSRFSFPVALVDEAAEQSEGPIDDDDLFDGSTASLAGGTLRFEAGAKDEISRLIPRLRDLPDVVEPFERIREAIKEAQLQMSRTRMPENHEAA